MMRRGVNRLRDVSRWAAPLVLGMLCLRALVPAGFMLVPVEGGLAYVLCDQDAVRLGNGRHGESDPHASGPTGHHHEAGGAALARAGQHHHHDGPAHHHLHPDPTCPYAQSSGPAPLPVLPQITGAATVLLADTAIERPQTNSHFGPERQHSPRGPPLSA